MPKIKLQVFPYIIFNFCKNISNLDNLISAGLKSVQYQYAGSIWVCFMNSADILHTVHILCSCTHILCIQNICILWPVYILYVTKRARVAGCMQLWTYICIYLMCVTTVLSAFIMCVVAGGGSALKWAAPALQGSNVLEIRSRSSWMIHFARWL